MPTDSQDAWLRSRSTNRSVSNVGAEICLNCWFFVDSTGIVIRLAAKAYALSGSDDEKLGMLTGLAATDHLAAIHGKVPQRFILNLDDVRLPGAIPASSLQLDPIPVFEDLFKEISTSLPDLIRSVDDEYEKFKIQLTEPFLWVLTSVFESSDGQLIARIS